MATKARIENGIVCEVLTADPFPPFHESLTWVDCGPEVVQGWTWDGLRFAAPVTPGPTQADIIQALTAALERMYDAEAQSHRYDNRFTCALRAGYPGPFQAEGLAFASWMDACNAHGYQVMAECEAGLRPIPTEAEFLAEMPVMVWP